MSANTDLLVPKKLSTPELVAMTAYLMALNALAIDVMLPAMSEIGQALGITNANDAQFIIVVYMLGFGTSQLVWGPVTDRFGRKGVLSWVLIGYILASLGCTLAHNFETLLIWRFILGIAAGGTRVIAVSVVRDLYVGRGNGAYYVSGDDCVHGRTHHGADDRSDDHEFLPYVAEYIRHSGCRRGYHAGVVIPASAGNTPT